MDQRTDEPFYRFAFDNETLLRSTKAKLYAVHLLLESGKDPGDDALDSVSHLIHESLTAVERMIEDHERTFEKAREARA